MVTHAIARADDSTNFIFLFIWEQKLCSRLLIITNGKRLSEYYPSNFEL